MFAKHIKRLTSLRSNKSFRDIRFSKVLIRYLAQGFLLNALGYIIYSILVYFNLVESIFIAAIMAALGLLPISYAVNRKWVFESRSPMSREVFRFFLVYALSIVLNLFLLLAVSIVINNPFLAQAICSSTVITATFLVNNIWTFKKQPKEV